MSKVVLVPLAEGFEEIEAITVIDVLRRAGLDVVTASADDHLVRGAHGVRVAAETTLAACSDRDFDMIVLPGGMPGAANLVASKPLQALLRRHTEAGRPLGAICAAPAVVLHTLGYLGSEKVACYPTFRERLDPANRTEERVCVGEKLVTGAAPGAAMEFALALVAFLLGEAKADELAAAMLVKRV
ncbi:DJ-1 family glyoxalase III [Aminiphilus circumscriptus]|uniref:DJ-1 family glyoxalase III n=1 Tax=Aminiphilus circumscriptus TaxID=290732 RepID=UPI00047864DA|nr:DJ-1 family glyoxalase III [Aminiphilus circumscriptus]